MPGYRIIFFMCILLIMISGCAEQEDINAHWRCSDGTYHRTMEDCYQNRCSQDTDCVVSFADGPCGKTSGVFPKSAILPTFERQRCSGEVCSVQTPECQPSGLPDFFMPRCNDGRCTAIGEEKKTIVLGGRNFDVVTATTPEEHAQGLMNVQRLEANEGMLFVFGKPAMPAFWMKNTLLPLDIIFIDKEKSVISVHTAQPCTEEHCQTYSPSREAFFVLEVNAGTAKMLNVSIGEKITINNK